MYVHLPVYHKGSITHQYGLSVVNLKYSYHCVAMQYADYQGTSYMHRDNVNSPQSLGMKLKFYWIKKNMYYVNDNTVYQHFFRKMNLWWRMLWKSLVHHLNCNMCYHNGNKEDYHYLEEVSSNDAQSTTRTSERKSSYENSTAFS